MQTLTNAQQKHINSLQQKKYRTEFQQYIIEGLKIVEEYILHTHLIQQIILADIHILSPETLDIAKTKNIEICICDEKIFNKLSALVTNQKCLAIAKIAESTIDIEILKTQKTIALDSIQDPGNLGTILRTADWFGIKTIICTTDTVDCYNPKVVQASMGSLCNVNVIYTDLILFLQNATNQQIPIYGTLLNGNSILQSTFNKAGVLLVGNESRGISLAAQQHITQAITIPKANTAFAESLNAATATAICCSHWHEA